MKFHIGSNALLSIFHYIRFNFGIGDSVAETLTLMEGEQREISTSYFRLFIFLKRQKGGKIPTVDHSL